jgi:hypothetical protein
MHIIIKMGFCLLMLPLYMVASDNEKKLAGIQYTPKLTTRRLSPKVHKEAKVVKELKESAKLPKINTPLRAPGNQYVSKKSGTSSKTKKEKNLRKIVLINNERTFRLKLENFFPINMHSAERIIQSPPLLYNPLKIGVKRTEKKPRYEYYKEDFLL